MHYCSLSLKLHFVKLVYLTVVLICISVRIKNHGNKIALHIDVIYKQTQASEQSLRFTILFSPKYRSVVSTLRQFFVLGLFPVLLAIQCNAAAQAPPDAGVILQNERKIEPEPSKPVETPVELPGKPVSEADNGVKVLVKGWKLSGNQMVSEKVLQKLLATH